MTPPPFADVAAADLPGERYGLQLVEEAPAGAARADAPEARPLGLLHWGLLAGFAAIQIAHLAGLAVLVRWGFRRLIGG